jgi:D-amino peptidase
VESAQTMTSASRSPTIFVSVDMEGCATLVHWDEVRPSASLAYQHARVLMTDEVNAVLAGAFAAGAACAIVNDSHSAMRNLLIERLDPRATVVSGRIKPHFMLEGLTRESTVAFFIGYHGAIGDANAVMGHTYSPRIIYECRLNGTPVGELPINAAFAGHHGVAVGLVSGDATTLLEARRVLPWALTVETKRSLSYFAADCRSPHNVCDELRGAAEQAVRSLGKFRPLLLESPILMEIDTLTSAQADAISLVPGMERPAARTLVYRAADAAAMYRALMNVIYVGANA